jgi:hypothetical protein
MKSNGFNRLKEYVEAEKPDVICIQVYRERDSDNEKSRERKGEEGEKGRQGEGRRDRNERHRDIKGEADGENRRKTSLSLTSFSFLGDKGGCWREALGCPSRLWGVLQLLYIHKGIRGHVVSRDRDSDRDRDGSRDRRKTSVMFSDSP